MSSPEQAQALAIRDVTESDFDEVTRLIHTTIDTCYPAAYCPEAVAHFREHHAPDRIRRRAREGRIVVLELEGRLAGTGSIVDEHVEAVFIDPELQGRGLGKAIMDHLEAIGRDNGFNEFTLEASTPARAFYESLGYAVLEAAAVPVDNGKTLDYFKMVRKVG